MHDCRFPQKFMRIPLKKQIDSLAKSAHLAAKSAHPVYVVLVLDTYMSTLD
jgi:hypothetical protein